MGLGELLSLIISGGSALVAVAALALTRKQGKEQRASCHLAAAASGLRLGRCDSRTARPYSAATVLREGRQRYGRRIAFCDRLYKAEPFR